MTKHVLFFLAVLLLLFSSCTSEDKSLSTYTVSYKNFENVLIVDGITEPVQSTAIPCPRSGSGGAIAYLIEDGTMVKEGDILCTIENKELENRYDQGLLNLENSKAGFEKTKADLNMQYALLEAQVKNNEAQTQIAQLDSLQLVYYSPTQRKIKELELKQVRIEKGKLDKKLKALSVIQQSEIRKLELEIQRTENHVTSMKNDLNTLTLKAARKGLATRDINPMTGSKLEVGDVCWYNMPLISIPEMDKMKVKIQATEVDYKYINIGDSVSYNFDALPNNVTWGKITNKMPVGKQHKEGSKVKFFEIEASIDSTQIMPDPGFTATCYIMLKTVIDTITIPQIAIFEQDSMKVVYAKTGRGYEARQIETAETSPMEAVIVRGLRKDDIITLRKPASSSIKGKKILSDSIKSNVQKE